MMLGAKRAGRPSPTRGHHHHHPMRRTTSMTEFAPPDVLADVAEEEDDEETEAAELQEAAEEDAYGWVGAGAAAAGRADWMAAYWARAAPALIGHRRSSADFSAVETAAFLRACGLCNRRLGPGRDTFMYKGDTAFCSLECRQQHMTHEEWKEKRALATAAAAAPPPPPPASISMPDPVAPASAGSGKPAAGGALAAA